LTDGDSDVDTNNATDLERMTMPFTQKPASEFAGALRKLPILKPSRTTSPLTPKCRNRAHRVVHVITPSRMAGAETFLARLLRRAEPEKIVNHCICSPSPANEEMLAANMSFEQLGIGGKANLLAVPRLRSAARRFNADLLHSHLSSASWWCGWLEQFGGLPSIGHVHGFTSALWHRRQSHLIACSAAVKKDLITKGISGDRITVMHYPIDPADMRPTRSAHTVRAEFGVSNDVPIVGTFAHLSVKKGYRELVQAAKFVLECMPTAQFWCFGEGPLRAELQQTADELGIAGRFRLPGFRRDVPDLMQAIDVMCLPSHREPFGQVYVEAALAEKPVVACDAGGASEIILHGETGLLVPPPQLPLANPNSAASEQLASNITPLADALFALLDNRSQAAAMGRKGRQRALDSFGWPNYLANLSELYTQVLDARKTGRRHAA
jgi:glycosyltransferase involved in cell wall biosynthesis